ncbi:MAG: elongation factor P-like protein YeiP [Lentisphaeraceae bacterium]|nr:elongation factor P-like protein YeiP [Lentisphaeraceae bacterium]
MIDASKMKKGMVLELNGAAHIIEKIQVKSPSARGGNTLYKVRSRNLVTTQKADHSFKGDDVFKEADYEKRPVQFSYIDGENYVFMDNEDYSQFELNKDFIGDDISFLLEDMDCTALIIDGAVKGLELPDTVSLKVVECDPSMKSASATARTKNAKLETGFELQVPEYLESGETIKVDTRTGDYISRAK